MTLQSRQIVIDSSIGTLRLGRRRPNTWSRHRLRTFMKGGGLFAGLNLPASVSWHGGRSLGQMYLNQMLGDCVIAGGYHILGVVTANGTLNHTPFIAKLSDIKHDYAAIGGWIEGRPSTDRGCDERTALNFWKTNYFAGGHKLVGWAGVNAQMPDVIKNAVFTFENLLLGLELPDKWISPPPYQSGFLWDIAGLPNPANGHAVAVVGYNDVGVEISTWGMRGWITWQALAYYCANERGGEAYTLLLKDQIGRGMQRAPNGYDWNALMSAMKEDGG